MIISVSILILGVIGIVAAVLLFLAAKKFYVYEDPRIGEIEELLPGANCGGCGFSGCHAFAVECTTVKSLEGLHCTSLNDEGLQKVATIVGLVADTSEKKVAIVKCGADCSQRKITNTYDGVESCALMATLYQGESQCVYGCLGCGDCVRACPFDAMKIESDRRLAHVDIDKCTGCGKCVEVCPRHLCVLAPLRSDRATVWVSCSNKDKGPVAMKECELSCIGCSKCRKVCPTEAPVITNFLAEITQNKCISCGKCIEACPRHCIFSSYEITTEERDKIFEEYLKTQ